METQQLPVLSFSQRMGVAEIKPAYQGQSMDRGLRVRLWNSVYELMVCASLVNYLKAKGVQEQAA